MYIKAPASPTKTAPALIYGRVGFPPRRRKNSDIRPREFLTEPEINKLMDVARRHNRWGHRDATAVLVAFSHGLRPVELCGLEWGQIDFRQGSILTHRAKNGIPRTHYLSGKPLPALRQLQRENHRRYGPRRYLFLSERGGTPVTTAWFRKMFADLGVMAKMPWSIHPHQLRHSCATKYANLGKDTRSLQGFLGHRNIQSSVVYCSLAPNRFQGWEKE